MASNLDTIIAQVTSIVKEAYELGKKDGVNALLQAAGHSASYATSNAISPVRDRPKSSSYDPTAERGYRPGTAIAQVHKMVQERPGMTTKEVVTRMEEEHGVSGEKTVRTSLNRLRDKWGGYIFQKDGKWYAK